MRELWQVPHYLTDPEKLFREQSRRHPHRLAVRSQQRSLTYAALDELSNRMAFNLDAGPDEVVAIAHQRSPEMLAALLAIFKRGAAYLPLDPREPPVRSERMVKRAKPKVILGEEELLPAEPSPHPTEPSPSLQHDAQPHHLAYVLFTSGSTGEPKGVMIERRGLMNNLASKVFDLPIGVGDGVAQTAPLCFDVSVWQLLAPLMAGARVEIVDPTDLIALADDLVAREIHILELVPSQIEVLLDELEKRPRALPLRWLIPTGEALPPELCRRWFRRYPHIPILNAYGPAECADDVATHILREPPPEDTVHIPIGKPLPNFEIHILNSQLEEVPEGEICISGIGVGRGYIDDPERTATSFVTWNGRRLYRTGDLGRLEDGNIVYLGRSDFQMKIRGERIELGEIEAAVRSHPEVKSVVVIPWERGVNDWVPVAYVVPEGIRGLSNHLKQLLTPAMQPKIVELPVLPLNANGKVDRSRLPAPTRKSSLPMPPKSDREGKVRLLFAQVLGLPGVSKDFDFFSEGGDSLTALRLVARLEEEFQVRISPSQLVSHPTPRRVAKLLNSPPLDSRLVQLKAGAGKPLLFLPGAGGHVVYLAHLARRLQCPVYGLEAKGLDGQGPPAESVEEEVVDVLAALRKIAPDGPYRLAGHSIGAWTAFETARVLMGRGERVDFLGLVGMPAPHLVPRYGEQIDSAGWLLILSELFARFFGQDLNFDHAALRPLAPDEQLDQVGEALKKSGILPPETDRERMRAVLRVYRAHHRICYRPETPYRGHATLFRTFEEGLRRPVLGWERYSSQPVKVRFVPGDHLSMMSEPHAEHLARALSEEM